MNNFKVGDIIVCINNDKCSSLLTKGREYLVTKIDDYYIYIEQDNSGNESVWFSHRFLRTNEENDEV